MRGKPVCTPTRRICAGSKCPTFSLHSKLSSLSSWVSDSGCRSSLMTTPWGHSNHGCQRKWWGSGRKEKYLHHYKSLRPGFRQALSMQRSNTGPAWRDHWTGRSKTKFQFWALTIEPVQILLTVKHSLHVSILCLYVSNLVLGYNFKEVTYLLQEHSFLTKSPLDTHNCI